ncbi:hypothetical protein OS493_011997 [Desmophyllum pertusum]|uniref:Uncharacterized protein n=1 Tax=Desmophyllum pertusum TaxID=174260 RepID=A0A9X0DBV0_9CNID|nr:hypothetical protein OS493_011997 [Desmophyllum pertusum]
MLQKFRSMLDAMLKAREAYTVWHKNAFGTEEGLLPLPDNKIKAFSADMAKAGYASHTIILYVYIYLSGLCTWRPTSKQNILHGKCEDLIQLPCVEKFRNGRRLPVCGRVCQLLENIQRRRIGAHHRPSHRRIGKVEKVRRGDLV